jgi:hypothetical protein
VVEIRDIQLSGITQFKTSAWQRIKMTRISALTSAAKKNINNVNRSTSKTSTATKKSCPKNLAIPLP